MIGSRYSEKRLLALAGVVSCSALVEQFATSGTCDAEALEFFVAAFIDTNPDSVDGFLSPNLAFDKGLQVLARFPQSKDPADRRLLMYSLQSIQVMQQFMKRSDLLKLLSEELPVIAGFNSVDEQLMACGQLYEKSVSTLPLRIQVQGSQGYLRQPLVAQKIRGMLFCAIRFALLWQQQGGSKFDFLLRKTNIRLLAQQLATKTT